jgi:putative hemolysin
VYIWHIVALVALTLVNGGLAMSEMAIVSARRSRLATMADAGDRGAARALALLGEPSRFLSSVQIGITFVGIAAGALGGATLAEDLGERLDRIPWIAPHGATVGFAVVIGAITYASLVIGELVPKRLALVWPERIAARVARPMGRLARLAGPLVWLLEASTEGIVRALGARPADAATHTHTEDEVRLILAEGARSGVLEPEEHRLIEGVLRLADRSVRTIMTLRPAIQWLDAESEREDQRAALRAATRSRLPVCRGALDELIGVVRAKDVLDRLIDGKPFDLLASTARPLVVPEGTSALELLAHFRASGEHLAVVADEYGTIEGLVTLTDVLQAIAGALPEGRDDAAPRFARRADGSWLIDGMAAIGEVEAETGLRGLAGEDYETLAGFVLWRLGHLPATGEVVTHRGTRFEVVDLDGRRIDKVLVMPAVEAESDIEPEA